ncbi:hypothetical protein HPK19_14780 [Arthrobacter citreus]|nr:hypothetical protein HPK19_14780 [Arthrobacter citreus]
MAAIIGITLMTVCGCVLMYGAIFSKKKDIDRISIFGAADLLELMFSLVFSFSSVMIKRVLLFIFGFLISSFFIYIFITGKY